MKPIVIGALAALLATGSFVVSAGQTPDAARRLKAAMNTELVDGNLKAAIEQYKAIAAGSDRAIAAQALLRMAECYQKLGDADALKIYERVIRDFADQKEAVTIARARFGGAAAPAQAKGDRAVWTGRDVDLFGTISPDGRFLTYIDWAKTSNLMLRDLVAGTSRALTNNTTYREFGYPGWSAISRNGEQVAFDLQPPDNPIGHASPNELRVGNVKGMAPIASRRIRQFERGESARPFDWSPDGEWLAVLVERTDRSSQIGLIAVKDGTFRPLKSIDWRGANKIVFSPDGRFIAYDLSVGDTRDAVHVFVMAADGSQERAIVDDGSRNSVMGWAPDGQIVFASNRSGDLALWTVAVEEGRATSAPRLVKENVGSTFSLGMTPSGTLYVWKMASAEYVKVAPIDLAGATAFDPNASTFQRFIESRGRPSWSADGKHFLYTSCGPTGGGPCSMYVRPSESGVVRQVPHRLGYIGFPRLSPDGRAILTDGSDLKGRRGIYLIDATTGETSLVAASEQNPARARETEWAADGRSFRYQRNIDDARVVFERQLGSEADREIFRMPSAGLQNLKIAPNGQFAAFVKNGPNGQTLLTVVPLSGGPMRTLLTATAPDRLNWVWQWMPGGQTIVIERILGSGERGELWHVPLDGRPTKTDLDVRTFSEAGGLLAVHPDGKQIAFVAAAGAAGSEVWALENFLPARAGKR